MTKPKDWLKLAIARGIQALRVLNLEGTPSRDTAVQTAEVWLKVVKSWPIAWDEQQDAPRLEAAFLQLASQCDRWPSPRQLKALLPMRLPPDVPPALPLPPGRAAQNLAKVRALSEGLANVNKQGSKEQKLKALYTLEQQLKGMQHESDDHH